MNNKLCQIEQQQKKTVCLWILLKMTQLSALRRNTLYTVYISICLFALSCLYSKYCPCFRCLCEAQLRVESVWTCDSQRRRRGFHWMLNCSFKSHDTKCTCSQRCFDWRLLLRCFWSFFTCQLIWTINEENRLRLNHMLNLLSYVYLIN